MSALPGKLITLEGIDGSGKSSRMAIIGRWLRKNNIPHVNTYEPGSTPLGEKIRDLLLMEDCDINSRAELFLFFADRAQHLDQVIRPALERGSWVVSDRFYDSSYAYQGGGRGLPKACIDAMVRWGCFGIEPDLTILFDISPERAWARRREQSRTGPPDDQEKNNRFESVHASRLEREKKQFFARVREAYLRHAECEPRRWRIVRAEREQDLVNADIVAILESVGRERPTW